MVPLLPLLPPTLVNQTVFQPVNGSTSHCSALGPLLICEPVPAYIYDLYKSAAASAGAWQSGLAVTQRGDLWAW